jgi:hypothetical protein
MFTEMDGIIKTINEFKSVNEKERETRVRN